MGQLFPLWWNHLPIVAGIADSPGLTHARAGVWCHTWRWYQSPIAFQLDN